MVTQVVAAPVAQLLDIHYCRMHCVFAPNLCSDLLPISSFPRAEQQV